MMVRMPTVKAALRVLVLVVFLAPVLLVLSGSLRRLGLPPPDGLEVLPASPSLGAFDQLGREIDLGTAFRNSALVVGLAVPLGVLVASTVGFAMSQLSTRRRRWSVGAVLLLLVVPLPMLWVARFVLYLELGVLDTLVPLVAPALAASTPVAVLLAYQAFRRVPTEHWEAARVEGASAVRTWWTVGLPQVRATTTAIAALVFTVHWGAYLDALLYVRSSAERTLPLAVAELRNLDPAETPVALAGALMLALPPLLLLLLAQRRLLSSLDIATNR
ncbi:MAG: N-Acetyl-D-glucosamine transport system, permease protein 2 [Frankiales bacterium]|jgi:multiple sugar transport system permease protein|nr:N-Acetyl-D-glucosamine transport system, permease protein 2 [Frankiales bacterium]